MTPVEVNKPGHASHGMRGHVVGRAGNLWIVDVDGVEAGFEQHELLFLKFRRAPEPAIDYLLRNCFWFVIGVAFGILARMVQE